MNEAELSGVMFSSAGAAVYTLGVGDLYLIHLLRWLDAREITHVYDVRSPPYEFSRPELFPQELAIALKAHEMTYMELSDGLGDRPRDISLHRPDHRLDYRRYLKRRTAQEHLSRIELAWSIGRRVCILGREADPVRSHHARLIGQGLYERQIIARHIHHRGCALITHDTLLRHIWMTRDSVYLSPEEV